MAYFDWEAFLIPGVCYSVSFHTLRMECPKPKCFEMNTDIKINKTPSKQKPSFKVLLSKSYKAFDSKNCLDLFSLSSSFFENNAPVLQKVAVFNYQLTHGYGFPSNRNINKKTSLRLNNGKFWYMSRFPVSMLLPEVFEG